MTIQASPQRDPVALLERTLRIYKWPSQAFWRYLEVKAYRNVHMEHPVLEIGCGNGHFTAMVTDYIDEAIDINPRAIEKSGNLGAFYRKLTCLDARDLQPKPQGFRTVYANCVVEHIPDLKNVLLGAHRSLAPGGQLVITVPLRRMNDFLLLRSERYARARQSQLAHVNLFTTDEWKEFLTSVGFSNVRVTPYLSGRECHVWDSIDVFGCIGGGRFTLANILGRATEALLPQRILRALERWMAKWLLTKETPQRTTDDACAALITAIKGAQ